MLIYIYMKKTSNNKSKGNLKKEGYYFEKYYNQLTKKRKPKSLK